MIIYYKYQNTHRHTLKLYTNGTYSLQIGDSEFAGDYKESPDCILLMLDNIIIHVLAKEEGCLVDLSIWMLVEIFEPKIDVNHNCTFEVK